MSALSTELPIGCRFRDSLCLAAPGLACLAGKGAPANGGGGGGGEKKKGKKFVLKKGAPKNFAKKNF